MSIWNKLFCGSQKSSGTKVVRWDQDIYHADPEVNRLIIELLKIGRTGGYIGKPGGEYDEDGRHKLARSIGTTLFQKGGHGLMVRAAEAVFRIGYPEGPLSSCWHGVGHWQA